MAPIPLQAGWLYGPVDSRRYGRSLGINPLPVDRKLCSLDCLYCQYGFTKAQQVAGRAEVPSASDLASAIEAKFAALVAADDPPDRITVAGNGEPTLHPEFEKFSADLAKARDQYFPNAQLGILCNGMHLDRPGVLSALNKIYDEPAMKLEWGNAACFAAMNQVGENGFEKILTGLQQIDSFVVQALFMQSPLADNSSDAEVASWVEVLRSLKSRIRHVEIYSLDRPPADAAQATAVPRVRLDAIADCARAIGLSVEVFTR
ncbi:MAG: radical SAM protein [Planctomycetes bacterium]|jgi:wyosine [tRNA(Phe)-imidazoG37] synthetase (radical SAM superfamily)|nr:radical SAM protein [Planctomycetota bacterium]MBT4029795.1 radical SAM protein [Planctomycetota bacterium]MBT4559889.1 radical SAM protein [Planctomycetota bacterium]MBT5101224.1 radical SAM protein [Planctomycetota bacterium]MBT5119558.1 radical SAM protein [Planctomycetota bacterium]